MIELLIQTLCDVAPPEQANGVYLFGQTADNQGSVFETGLNLWQQRQAGQVLISGAEALGGYPGFQSWRQALISHGLRERDIIGIPPTNSTRLHTLIEAESLVRYALAQGFSRIFVTAAPFHQLRAFMTTVTVVLREFPELQVFNRVGATLPWNETVHHSQGTLRCARQALIQSELERISIYQAKGDLAPTEQVLGYLNWRNDIFNIRTRT